MKISASQRERIGVSISIFVAFCLVLRLSSAEDEETTEVSGRVGGTELKCCICNFRYVGDKPLEQCGCHSNPKFTDPKYNSFPNTTNCTGQSWKPINETEKKGKKKSSAMSGEKVVPIQADDSCFAYTSYQNKTNSFWFTRTTFPTGAIPGAIVTENCTWMNVSTYNKEDGFTTIKVCECKTDFCNCGDVDLAFIGVPVPPPASASYNGAQFLLTALLSVLASKSFQ